MYEGCRRLINHDFMDEWQVAGDGRGGICWAEDVIGLIARSQRGQNCGQMYGQKCAQKEGAQNAFHPRRLSAICI